MKNAAKYSGISIKFNNLLNQIPMKSFFAFILVCVLFIFNANTANAQNYLDISQKQMKAVIKAIKTDSSMTVIEGTYLSLRGRRPVGYSVQKTINGVPVTISYSNLSKQVHINANDSSFFIFFNKKGKVTFYAAMGPNEQIIQAALLGCK
jgi:hypothetical protein